MMDDGGNLTPTQSPIHFYNRGVTASPLSLLWPGGTSRARTALNDNAAADLGIGELARAIAFEPRQEDRVRGILLALCDDPTVITYRQDVLDDLMRNTALADGLQALLPSLGQLGFYGNPGRPNEPALQQTLFRLAELELYVDCVERLRALLLAQGDGLRAEGLLRLRDALGAIERDASFQALRAELPDMLSKVRNIGSVTIGINLDAHMLPMEATLLSINGHRFKGSGVQLIDKLLGKKDEGGTQGLARLHRIALPNGMPYTRDPSASSGLMLVPLFKDLSDVLEAVSRPIADALARYARVSGQGLIALESEIGFYLGAIRLIHKVQAAGLPMCRPEIAPNDARSFEARGLFNLAFALRLLGRNPQAQLSGQIVPNDATFDDEGRIHILTGPNQGGKTTFITAIGLIHVLAQAGLHVPAGSARLSPCDAIHTHFAKDEQPSLESGRLGEEAKRLSEIFARATRHSLVLLNESLSSTSPNESLFLARDVVRGLRLLGARAIFATHLHGLAEEADDINASTPGESAVASLVSVVERDGDDGRRTYRIVAGRPTGLSHARDIARRFGISFEQIEAVLKAKPKTP
jgi:hypothetical protein